MLLLLYLFTVTDHDCYLLFLLLLFYYLFYILLHPFCNLYFFSFFPCTSPDFKLETGVTIPARAVLVVPVQLLQMDDSSWGQDASEFNPYRFLSKAGNGSDLVLTSSTGFTPE